MIPPEVLAWKDLAQKYADLNPPVTIAELLTFMTLESSGTQFAVNVSDPSWGLYQLTFPIAKAYGGLSEPPARLETPGTPPSWGYDTSSQVFDPDFNMGAAAKFIAHLKKAWGTEYPDSWMIGYNEGETNLGKGRPDPAYLAAFTSHLAELNELLDPPDNSNDAMDEDLGT